jgi:hypothetical protein
MDFGRAAAPESCAEVLQPVARASTTTKPIRALTSGVTRSAPVQLDGHQQEDTMIVSMAVYGG